MTRVAVFSAVLLGLVAVVAARPAAGQPATAPTAGEGSPGPRNPVVREIRVEGLVRVSEPSVLRRITSQPGAPLDRSRVQACSRLIRVELAAADTEWTMDRTMATRIYAGRLPCA